MIYGYLVLALAFAVSVAGAGWKGYSLGEDHARAEFAAERDRARAQADEARKADQDAARKSAAVLQAALSKQKRLNADLGTALEAHIRAMPKPPAGCPEPRLTDGLFDSWNSANRGGKGAAGGILPAGSGTAAPTDRPDDSGDGAKPRGGS